MSKNINLIVCDVDGTLLPKNEHKICSKVKNMIDSVKKSEINFALASGRSKLSLTDLFNGSEDIFLVCLDGSVISHNGEIIFNHPIPQDKLKKTIPKLNGNDFILYGIDSVYTDSEKIISGLTDAEKKALKSLSDFDYIEKIYKIAIFSIQGTDCYAVRYIKSNNLLNLCYSSPFWVEYIDTGTDKGIALEFLQKYTGTCFEATAAFGDNINDIGMLKKAYFSYAVGNARPEIKALTKFSTDNAADEIVNNILK